MKEMCRKRLNQKMIYIKILSSDLPIGPFCLTACDSQSQLKILMNSRRILAEAQQKKKR